MKKDLGLFEQTEILLFVTKQELAIALYSGCYIDPRLINDSDVSVPLSIDFDPMNVYEGQFPTVLLEKTFSDSKFEYPIGIRISSIEKTVPITIGVRKLENHIIALQSFDAIVFQNSENEIDFLETSGQFIISETAKSIKRIVDPNPFVGASIDTNARKLSPSKGDIDAERFDLLERCASGILAATAARRTSSIGGQVLISLIPGTRRAEFAKQFGPILTAVIDHRRSYSSKASDAVGSIFQSWANVFLMVPEEAINPREILQTCIEATKTVQIPKGDLVRILEQMSLIDDCLTSKIEFTPIDNKNPHTDLDSLIFCLKLALMRTKTEELLEWEYTNHKANEPEFIAAAYLTGLLKPRRKQKQLRDDVIENILIANQISSMKKGLDHLEIALGNSIEVKPNDVLVVKINDQLISKPYGSSWNIKKNNEQDLTPKEIPKPQDVGSNDKFAFNYSLSDYNIEIVDGILRGWPKVPKKS
jgi:hypothetical protein